MSKNLKKLTRCALLSALGSALICISALFPTLSLSIVAASGLMAAAALRYYGMNWGVATYVVTSVLALLLAPDRECALFYIAFFGYYPILQGQFGRIRGPVLRWTLKLLFCNVLLVLSWFASKALLFSDIPDVPWIMCLTWAFFNAAFVLYDLDIARLLMVYYHRIAPYFD